MSKYDEFAQAIYAEVAKQGDLNGQRWFVDREKIAELAREHFPASSPARKKATKKKAPSKEISNGSAEGSD